MISREFIKKTLSRLDKIDLAQIALFVQKVAQDNDFFYRLLDQNEEGILILNQKQDIEYVNPRALEILRFEIHDQLVGKSFEAAIQNQEFKEYLKIKIENHQSIKDEEHVIGSPHIRVIRVNFYFLRDNANSVEYAILRLSDITRKKLEEIRDRRQENITSMGHLAAGLAHEIKNPLASVDIHLKLLKRYLGQAPQFDEKNDMDHFIFVLQEEVNRLTDIVQDFLSAIRPISLDLKRVSVVQLIYDLMQFLDLELKENNIQVEMAIEDNLPAVLADHRYLRIAFLNLIKNAIEVFDNQKQGNKITIKISENYPFVELLIADNGPGILPEKLEKIFEPYFSTKSFGTGIGLTMVHKIVTEHNGNIKVESQIDVGTSFTLMIPQYQGESAKFLENHQDQNLKKH